MITPSHRYSTKWITILHFSAHLLFLSPVHGWLPRSNPFPQLLRQPSRILPKQNSVLADDDTRKRQTLLHVTTPFEADLYDNPFEDDGDGTFSSSKSPLAIPPGKRDQLRLVLGLNKYSHDTALCAADAQTGQVLYAQAKERIGSRKKHDAGNVASLVETCLEALDLDLSHVDAVVMNNHHHRILPLEEGAGYNSEEDKNNIEEQVSHMEWEAGLYINGGQEDGYLDPENLLPNDMVPTKLELSHHLAHAYSAAAQAPFDNGLIVIMDGMGETYRTMQHALHTKDTRYVSDYTLLEEEQQDENSNPPSFQSVPSNLDELARYSRFDWREAETVYTFQKNHDNGSLKVTPVFKRFTQEHSPPVLYNHGFENMDSLGALYSRASSHIFGDWNACGKVMGLAPWANSIWRDNKSAATDGIQLIQPQLHDDSKPIVSGSLYKDNDLKIDRNLMRGLPFCARNDPDLFVMEDDGNLSMTSPRKRYDFDTPDHVPDYSGEGTSTSAGGTAVAVEQEQQQKLQRPTQVALDAIALASRMQNDLETVAMDFVRHFKQETGQENLCLAGGVALNSVLNGRLSRELDFEQTFIPPYPGDDGIAIGCCAYGLFGRGSAENEKAGESPTLWKEPLSPYLGGVASDAEIKMALQRAEPWIEIETIRDDDQRYQRMVDEIASGGVIAWYRSRSEMGPRALGHRSILADPRKHGLVRFINEHVKSRESFRPFAPSCLADEAHDWFELGSSGSTPDGKFSNVSPFMSITAQVKEHQRHKIPAVTHVDGSSRLQTVRKEDEPFYHALISKFFKATGIPMVLNTSFNTLPSEPIVETPEQAIRSFLYTQGNLEMLVLDDYVITRKTANLRSLLGEVEKEASGGKARTVMSMEPTCPKRAGPVSFQATFDMSEGPSSDDEEIVTTTRVQMPDRLLHRAGEWTELVDELEAELLSICDGTVTLNEILAHYTSIPDDDQNAAKKSKKRDYMDEETQQLLQNIVHRMARLHDQTFLYW